MKQTIYIPVKVGDETPPEREELHLINNGLLTTGFYQDGQWYLGEHETPVLSFKGEWLKPVEIPSEEELIQSIRAWDDYYLALDKDYPAMEAHKALAQAITKLMKGEKK